ncbi:hypothetical protein PAECIP111892_00140 [Paenibacillus auburnensis]|jgi:hypothetical protein|uniref:Exosporium leader peptide n=1 Tax=Paenibacillus auburnensis TaxID=2905649 RepID=A0ABN8FX90_9BACL|nr:hypothetical protein [Paenibacillus auburnensis]CAH1190389.1 hypothetical protein PAECIP111892_00140 [Paenibacillus auburnensis]
MTLLLDSRTSQNASFASSLGDPFPAILSPQLYGQVGLNIVRPTGNIRVEFFTTVTILQPAETPPTGIFVIIVRGISTTDPIIYSALEVSLPSNTNEQVLPITVIGSDFNVPAPENNELIYSAFVSTTTLGPVRIGPESFTVTAYSD